MHIQHKKEDSSQIRSKKEYMSSIKTLNSRKIALIMNEATTSFQKYYKDIWENVRVYIHLISYGHLGENMYSVMYDGVNDNGL